MLKGGNRVRPRTSVMLFAIALLFWGVRVGSFATRSLVKTRIVGGGLYKWGLSAALGNDSPQSISRTEEVKQSLKPEMDVRSVLWALTSFRSSEDEKRPYFERLEEMRNQRVELNCFLDKVLVELDTVKDSYWANLPFPWPIPSYRVKLATTRRLVYSILEAEDSSSTRDSAEDDNNEGATGSGSDSSEGTIARKDVDTSKAPQQQQQQQQQRLRRALLIILGQLETTRGIKRLEVYASRSRKASASIEEMLKRTPESLETPTYSVIERQPNWEIRSYREFAVCSTVMNINANTSSSTAGAGGGAFNSLAGYIFGRNEAEERMSMTTPVITTPMEGDDGTTKMSFVMPSQYWGNAEVLQAAPKPLKDSNVMLETGGGGMAGQETVAVLWFGGYATKVEVERRTSELKKLIKAYPLWKEQSGPEAKPFLLQYNDPFQPPWKRRNEIAIPVRPVK